jgi:PLP dependent protein
MTGLISESLKKVRQHLADAELAAGRPGGSVRLIAVSKNFPVRDIQQVYLAGQRDFGESHVQELQHKAAALATLDINWHFLGTLQANKTRSVAKLAHWVHSVDRLHIAQRLSTQRPPGLPALNVCIQVNVSGEASKSGCTSGQLFQLACAVNVLPRIVLRGLMCIPAPTANLKRLIAQFTQLRSLNESLITQGFTLDTLSMGMSSDMLVAVAEGATMVRVGTAIFGPRHAIHGAS